MRGPWSRCWKTSFRMLFDVRPVEVSLAGDGHVARLSVRDDGIGISERDHAQIFKRFQTLPRISPNGGFGVGLWGTRRLARLRPESDDSGKSSMRLLPAIDLLQRAAHELRPIAVRQTIGVAKRCDALLVGQHAAGHPRLGSTLLPLRSARILGDGSSTSRFAFCRHRMGLRGRRRRSQ